MLGNTTGHMSQTPNGSPSISMTSSWMEDYDVTTEVQAEAGGATNLRIADDVILKVIYLVIGSFGLLSNMAVIIIISMTGSMRRKLTNKFILNQSSVDLCASLMLVMTTATSQHYYKMSGLWGHIVCRFWLTGYPVWSMFMTSTYCLLALTIERYVGVVHTFWHMKHFTRWRAGLLMTCAWLVGPAYQLYLPLTTRMVDGQCYRYKSWVSDLAQRLFGFLTITLEFIIPFFVMLYCYVRMLLVVVRRMESRPTDGSTSKEDSHLSRASYNVVVTLIFVCVCFILCWCWNEVFFLTFNLGVPIAPYSGIYHHFSVVTIYCNCCVNPIVYSLRYQAFRRASKRLFFTPQGATTRGSEGHSAISVLTVRTFLDTGLCDQDNESHDHVTTA